MPKKAKDAKEKILNLERTIAKQEATLNATKEKLKAEKEKQLEANMKKLEQMCSKSDMAFEDVISLIGAIAEKGLSMSDVLSVLKLPTESKEAVTNEK